MFYNGGVGVSPRVTAVVVNRDGLDYRHALLLDCDGYLEPDCLGLLVWAMDEGPGAAVCGPRVMAYLSTRP